MTAKPILFSGPMLRGLLEGRKIQTRRIVKPQPQLHGNRWLWQTCSWTVSKPHCPLGNLDLPLDCCPYGTSGHLLWVKETWIGVKGYHDYAATCAVPTGVKKNSALFMPRWASRLTLELTDVRVERLRDISREDALAEGIAWSERTQGYSWMPEDGGPGFHGSDPRESFWKLWDSINGEGESWKNPWCWVLRFNVHRCNIDDYLKGKAA